VGSVIDCISYFELEQAEYAAKGVNLSVEAWLVKLMVSSRVRFESTVCCATHCQDKPCAFGADTPACRKHSGCHFVRQHNGAVLQPLQTYLAAWHTGLTFRLLLLCPCCWQVGAIDPEYDGQDEKDMTQQEPKSKLGGFLRRGLRSFMS
jgi:hypothetical protein